MSEGWFTIIGVAVGFLLSELALVLRGWSRERRLREALVAELSSIVAMIPNKDEILEGALEKYGSGHVMPIASTKFPRIIYEQVITTAPALLPQNERDCLHIAYERLRVIDWAMDTTEDRFNSITTAHSAQHAVDATVRMIKDLRESLNNTSYLVQSVLDKKPVNVFQQPEKT